MKEMSFGDFRRAIIGDITAVREGDLSVAKAQAMGALYREVNANIQAEINATKMSLATEEKAHQFGRVVQMGQRLIDGKKPEEP